MGRLSSKERKKRKRLDELNQADAPRADAAPEAAEPRPRDKKRGPGEFSELVLGLLPHPGIK